MSLAGAEETSNEGTFETFDDMETIAQEADAIDDDWSKPAPEEKVSEDLKVIKDSQADADGKVIKEDKKQEKEDEEEEEEQEEEEKEEKEEKEEEKPKAKEEAKESKKLRVRMGDELYNIDSDATFKVKVDGENQEVTAQELINNYSGKVAWDKKFTEIGKEKKTLEFEKVNLTKQKETLSTHLKNALAPLEAQEGNPLDSLMYLVEMSGKDPYNAYRRVMEANLDELGKLLDMTETERELYFHKKKDQLYDGIAKKRQEREQEEQTFNQVRQKVDSLRQTYSVSEEQFVEASEELESIYESSGLNVNDLNYEAVVDYASLKPHIAVVKGLVEPYQENISEAKYGDVVAELSRKLRDGSLDKEAIQEVLKRNFSVEEEVKELNTKVYSKAQKAPAKKALKEEPSKFESFDDWD
jgi:hypothetical protein